MAFLNKQDNREVVVILGTGWAGFNLIRKLNRKKYRVVVISPRDYFLFTTLLFGVATKSNPVRSARYPIMEYIKEAGEYVPGTCTKIDFKNKSLQYKPVTSNSEAQSSQPITLNFDKIIICVGQTPNNQEIEGVYEHALFMNQLEDAQKLYKAILNRFDEANSSSDDQVKRDKLHFIVVGGGPTGVETVGELVDFLNNTMLTYYPQLRDKFKLSLFHKPDGVLTSFPSKLSKYTKNHLLKCGVNLISDKSVKQIQEDHVLLDDNTKLKHGLIVWAVGNKPLPLIDSLKDDIKIERGKILTNNSLQILDGNDHIVDPSCFALGDCSMIKDVSIPSTAQAAGQQAKYLAKALNRNSLGKPFKFDNLGSLAYIGKHSGVANLRLTDLIQLNLSSIFGLFIYCGAYWSMSFNWNNLVYLPYYWIKTGIYGKTLKPFYEDEAGLE